MNKAAIIDQLANKIRNDFYGETTGHDWYHIERVWKNAKLIASNEKCDPFIAELGALLHDIADHKFVENFEAEEELRTHKILSELNVDDSTIAAVLHIVQNVSFKGGIGENKMRSIEGLIVQDADRLDAIGAIGIARTFAFGGKYGNMIYDPEIKPTNFQSEEEYRIKRTHTINHFYEKLLLLKDLMNTDTGKKLAAERHDYMKAFLDQFYAEWDGKL
ncbi:HD domain-containing protein [Paracrocinitomix mangrovi]|uniref:HD domain-containing protein n=1 Tax=Paracrocinitomix mangrovi TaxID=2862509 RepID=UPI001C8E61DD|nr:HD domain-containing protein [Paracrocinitomix mangrovi]UKN02660.1 HD domain-containing protein [Paracrocinitomix mangrovi]